MSGLKAFWLAVVLLVILAIPCISADPWLYDAGLPRRWGVVIPGGDSPLRGSSPAIWASQSFYFPESVKITRLSAALAKGSDLNNAGYKVTLVTDRFNIAGTTLGSWTVHPLGPVLQYMDWDIEPVALNPYQIYTLVFSPGDSLVYGSLAYAGRGQYLAQASVNNGASWYDLPYPTAVRIGGTIVPEPQSAAVLAPALGCLLFRFGLVHLNAHRKKVGSNKARA